MTKLFSQVSSLLFFLLLTQLYLTFILHSQINRVHWNHSSNKIIWKLNEFILFFFVFVYFVQCIDRFFCSKEKKTIYVYIDMQLYEFWCNYSRNEKKSVYVIYWICQFFFSHRLFDIIKDDFFSFSLIYKEKKTSKSDLFLWLLFPYNDRITIWTAKEKSRSEQEREREREERHISLKNLSIIERSNGNSRK